MRKIYYTMMLCIFASMTAAAQNRLKPIDKIEQEIWGKNEYKKMYEEKAQQNFMVFPSFTPPFALHVYSWDKDKKRLVYKTEAKTYEMETTEVCAKKLKALFEHAVNVSMYPYEHEGLDGTQYFFFDRYKGATCWSPYGNCKRMVDVLTNIMDAVKDKSQERVNAQMPVVDSLTTVFKSYYPDDYFCRKIGSMQYQGVKNYYVTMDVGNTCFKFKKDKYEDGIQKCVDEKYGELVEKVCRELFINTSVLEDYLYVEVIPDEADIPDNSKKRTFVIHESDMNEETLAKKITEWYNKP